MSPEQLSYYLEQTWQAGVAYGTKRNRHTGLSEQDLLNLKEYLAQAAAQALSRKEGGR
jgi:hypothetical protein